MSKIDELRSRMKEALRKMRDIIDRAEDEKRDMSESEDAEYKKLDASIDKIKYEISKQERMTEIETESRKIMNPFPHGALSGNRRNLDGHGFQNVGEFLSSLYEFRTNQIPDERLFSLRVETREQTLGTGSQGGFNVPEAFLDTLLSVTPQESVIRPRATVIPKGDPPDVRLNIPTLDQRPEKGIYGGVAVAHSGEGITLTETDADFRSVSLEPKRLDAYLVCSVELLNNWSSASSILETLLRRALFGQLDYDWLRGDGVNKAIGIVNSPAAIVHSRAGAGAISWADCYTMYSKLKMGGFPVWIASQTVIPQLIGLTDAGTHSVFVSGSFTTSGAAQPMPGTLMGFPILWCDRSATLGNKGDLVLADLSYYLIKDGTLQVDVSPHVFFTSAKVAFRILHWSDAKPWLTEPLLLEGSSNSYVSPFVVLE